MQKMKYEAIIFDLDGTLWNVNESCTKAWNTFLGESNYKGRISADGMNSVTGIPMEKCIDILLPGIRKEYSDIKNILISYEKETVGKNGGEIYPDVLLRITELSHNFKIFIVSNCEQWYLNKFIGYSGLGPVLTDWDCHGSSGVDKHVMITNMKKKYHLNKVIYVGDTMHDKNSAELSDSDFIQVTYGFDKPISDAKRFDSFNDLYSYFINIQ